VGAELATLILFGGLLVLLALGVRVFIALGIVCIITTLLVRGPTGLQMVGLTTYQKITDISLIAIPLFVFMGNLLVHSGISDRLFTALSHWLSKVRGGLAVVSMIICVILAMCSGFTPGLITMGLIAVPAMLKRHYDKSLTLGSVMAGGILGDVIPPSLMMIIMGSITRISIGKLFFGGAVPGFICAGIYIAYILIRSHFKPELAPVLEEKATWKMRWVSLREVILPALLVVLILGSIFTGIATPSEAAGVGAFGSLLCCILYRKFNWRVISSSCMETIKITGMALWILVTATLFGQVYASAGAQGMVMGLVEGLEVNRWFIIIAMQIILLAFGMFMDDFAIIIICAPIFMPIALSLGFDPIWFGIVFILNMQMAYMTPPFGWCLILMKGIAPPEVTTTDIWRSVPPFVAMQLLVLILTMVFPMLALWLPGKMI
jgi:tripartite ATP-independent transporter DctM subunit